MVHPYLRRRNGEVLDLASASPAAMRGVRGAELAVSAGVLALGLGASWVAAALPEGGGYARIGPNFVPRLVAGGLVVLGLDGFSTVNEGLGPEAADRTLERQRAEIRTLLGFREATVAWRYLDEALVVGLR